MKIRVFKIDYLELKKKLIQYRVLVSYWDLNQFSQEIGISTKKKYIQTQMQLLSNSNNLTLIKRILDDSHFPFIYNGNKIKKDKEDFFELR